MGFHDGYLTLAIPIAVWIWRRPAPEAWKWLALVALGHVTAVVALTIFPIPIAGQDFYRQTRGLSEDNYVPFATIVFQLSHPGLNSARQLVGNAIVLAPFGVYAPALWPGLRDWRRFVLVAVAFGVGIELAQLAGSLIEGFTYRVTDVDDAMMNAAGAVAAFLLWPRAWPAIRPWIENRLGTKLESHHEPSAQ
jgi:glycopeptide antibiotics resistance protein